MLGYLDGEWRQTFFICIIHTDVLMWSITTEVPNISIKDNVCTYIVEPKQSSNHVS